MAKNLNTYVTVSERDEQGNLTGRTGTFGPDDDLSKPENAWVAKNITNPDVFSDGDTDGDGVGRTGESVDLGEQERPFPPSTEFPADAEPDQAAEQAGVLSTQPTAADVPAEDTGDSAVGKVPARRAQNDADAASGQRRRGGRARSGGDTA